MVSLSTSHFSDIKTGEGFAVYKLFHTWHKRQVITITLIVPGERWKFAEINLVLWGCIAITGFKAAGFVLVPDIYIQSFVSLPRKSLKNTVVTDSHFPYVTYYRRHFLKWPPLSCCSPLLSVMNMVKRSRPPGQAQGSLHSSATTCWAVSSPPLRWGNKPTYASCSHCNYVM